jgi:hypothetical protein
VPQSPRSWADSKALVWSAVGELRKRNPKVDEWRIGQLLAELMEGDDDLRQAAAQLITRQALTDEGFAAPTTPRIDAASAGRAAGLWRGRR